MSLETGAILNNTYRIMKLLSENPMGNLYLAERIADNEKFVIKELLFSPQTGINESAARDIFFRQSEFMARCNHPGLPKTYGVFNQAGKDYLTMEYMEGQTLEEIMNSSPQPVSADKALRWLIELADAAGYLHRAFHTPIVHRNLIPSNIIITQEGKVKLADFGVLRYYSPDKNTDTFRYSADGYGAPEQYDGKGQSTPQSDIFGLGVILYQMFTGYDPAVKPLTFPKIQSPCVPAQLEDIITKAIELEPQKRYKSMAEFKEALEKYLGIYKKPPPKPVHSPSESSGDGSHMSLTTIVILIVLIFFAISFVGTYYSSVNSRKYGQFAACESNLKNIATSLEMYATDFDGHYPPSLSLLTANLPPVEWYDINKTIEYLKKNPEDKLHEKLSKLEKLKDNSYSKKDLMTKTLKKNNFTDKEIENIESHALNIGSSGAYMRSIPNCPKSMASYTYAVSRNPDNFTLCCGNPCTHTSVSSIPKSGCWPQYNALAGLKTSP